MSMLRKVIFSITLCLTPLCIVDCKLPELTPAITASKLNEIMKAHASNKKMTPELVDRTLKVYLEILDPNKSYLIESDVDNWQNPSEKMITEVMSQLNRNDYSEFEKMHQTMVFAIQRRHEIEKAIDPTKLPQKVNPEEFKDMKWVKNEHELLTRIERIKSLQNEASEKLSEDQKDKTLKRIEKRQAKFESEIVDTTPHAHEQFLLSNVLKAVASSLDAHTAYFTPDEASQFMIHVQQRLFGIGAQLRDDLNGFSIIKIIDGGPATQNKELKVKDRIIAINGEPVVGLDIVEAVELIRGEEGTPVTLTVIREIPAEGDTPKKEEKHDIVIKRGEVVLKESRFESSYEPFGDGVIAYLKLFSFYQDPESSSAQDLNREIQKLRDEQNVKGVILDLRFNSGGLLSQAVDVTGLFISKGIVVSIKDNAGKIQHLRHLEDKTAWDGPLVVLINRASASASEIVAGTLQDYGRALIAGDDHSFGKGSFQTFTLTAEAQNVVNPQGEYKVTRGRYYTVSGRTPQLTGVQSDVVIPGLLSEAEVGEKFSKYPLENDHIAANFDDNLSDVPFYQRDRIKLLYNYNLQQRTETYKPYIEQLNKNTAYRVEKNLNFQNFLKEIKKKDVTLDEESEEFGQNDLQLTEAYNVMKDLIILTPSK